MSTHVVVEADGGSRGNPGPAGFGAVVRDAETGQVLAERQAGLGVATNNAAEYRGLVAGLQAAMDIGASTVDVRMDSKLVVEQMSGRWKIKNAALQLLAVEARNIAAGFARVRYEWIPRADNAHADRLANAAMDNQVGTHTANGEQAAEQSTPKTTEVPRTGPAAWSGATGTPTRMLLVRHGQTEHSTQRRYSGRGEVSLTERGVAECAAIAKRLAGMSGPSVAGEPATVVASPLTRTMQTASVVASALDVPVRTHPGLLETDFGSWEGLTFDEAAWRDPDLHRRWLADSTVRPPGGESFHAVYERVRDACDELLAEHAGRTIVLVSHVTPIKSVLRVALDAGPSLLRRLHLDPASISIAEFYPDGNTSVRLVNDTSHVC